MLLMVIGIAIFLLVHLIPTSTELRRSLVERYGLATYKIGFAIVALIGLSIIILGYGKLQLNPGKNPVLWDPPIWAKHLNLLLMFPAMILLVAAYVPSRIRTAMKHPMLVAVKLWALGHLLANGDLGSITLFGSFLAWAVYDRISVKKRSTAAPLNTTDPTSITNDMLVLVLGSGLYVFMLVWGHPYLIGVPILPIGN